MQDERLKHFNLVGGTALALYMGHRKSIDLDFFSQEEFDTDDLESYLSEKYNFNMGDTEKKSRATLIGFIDGIKVDCISYHYPFVEPVNVVDGVRMCSMVDIAAMKLTAISQTGTRLKDFIDVAFLSTRMSFNDMLGAFEIKYPNTNKYTAIKGLTYFDDIDFSVKVEMIGGKYRWKEIEKRLLSMVDYPDKVFLSPPCLKT
ncbi:MAG: nucleotidyl transferase AbiEii/AbiGii toxin family protein [Tannerellaceae bacterium]|jgi:hypothetical protein|nr:nucleotidyl transferase AbiEii/AbiGii toxin family protein [Tannerellaceae bacterium]